jgi:hypothetical protein
MPKRYMEAREAVTIAAELIEEFHPHLLYFETAFLFVVNEDGKGQMKYPKPNQSGLVVLGKAKAFSEAERTAGTPSFLIVLLYNFWEQATDAQRRALIDHELCHCGVKEPDCDDDGASDVDAEPKPIMLQHEFVGFHAELDRNGAWDHTLKLVQKQLTLDLGGVKHNAETGEVLTADGRHITVGAMMDEIGESFAQA